MIRKLEMAGLGYHIDAEKTRDRIGKIPLRRLVYRVKEIPASMFPLIWDFGTLDSDTEEKYVRQMIQKLVREGEVAGEDSEPLLGVLSTCQRFMRRQTDECSFVSLRDVERTLKVLAWFEDKTDLIHGRLRQKEDLLEDVEDFAISLALAVGVTYLGRYSVLS